MRKRKIKFALEMKDGHQARSIEELREYFDLEKIVGYFQDGKLLEWLRDRFCEDEAEQIEKLKTMDKDWQEKLCRILGADFHHDDSVDDMDAILERNKRIEMLKQYTSDANVIDKVDEVAFNQDELAELLRNGIKEIYLCGKIFNIPLTIENIKYVGVGKEVRAFISSDEFVDFDELGIEFENISFDDEYEKIHREAEIEADNYIATAKQLMKAGKAEDAITWLEKAAQAGNETAMLTLGDVFYAGRKSVEKDYNIAENWYLKALKAADRKIKRSAAKKLSDLYKNKNVQARRAKVPVEERKELQIKEKEYYKMALDLGYRPRKTSSRSKVSSGGCFITSAVYEALGRNDECYELNAFRDFRDNWLVNQVDGKDLIDEYYVVAPIIVRAINHRLDNQNIYEEIYREYLAKCLSCIENGDFEGCKAIYIQMVKSLKRTYFH